MKQENKKNPPGTAFNNAVTELTEEQKKIQQKKGQKKGQKKETPKGALSAQPAEPAKPETIAPKTPPAALAENKAENMWDYGLTSPIQTADAPTKENASQLSWDYKLGSPVKTVPEGPKVNDKKGAPPPKEMGAYWGGGLYEPVLSGAAAQKAEKGAAKKTKAQERLAKWEEFQQKSLADIQKHYPGLKTRPPKGMSTDFYNWATQTKGLKPEEAVTYYKDISDSQRGEYWRHEDDDMGFTTLAKSFGNTLADIAVLRGNTEKVFNEELFTPSINRLGLSASEHAAERAEFEKTPDRAVNRIGDEVDRRLASVGIYAQEDGTYKDAAGAVFSSVWEASTEGIARGMDDKKIVPEKIPELYDPNKAWKEYLEKADAAEAQALDSPEGQTIETSGAKTEAEGEAAVDATQSEIAAPPESQKLQEEKDKKIADSNAKPTTEAATNGGQTASGDEHKNAGDKVRDEGGTEEEALAADYVEYNVPKGMMTEPLRKHLNTMPPATEAETGFFESPAFQTSLLTFGLAMLMGKDSGDAMRIAGNAYYRENYKTTKEYKDFRKYGVPDSVIYQAVSTDDWTEVQKWYNEGKKAWDEQEKARIEAQNPYKDLGSTQELVLTNLLGRHKVLTKSMEDIWMAGNMAAQYRNALKNGEDINQLDGVLMMNVMQRFIDPGATVRGEDVSLIQARLSIPQWARNMYTKYFGHVKSGDENGFKAAFNKMSPDEMNAMVNIIEKGVATQMEAARSELRDYSASAYNSGIGAQWHSWNQDKFARYQTPYEKDVADGLFDEKNE